MTTLAPALANAFAVASPMPPPAPVTIATFPENSELTTSSCFIPVTIS